MFGGVNVTHGEQANMAKLKSPYKDLLPPLSTEEYEALRADIKANGVRNPVLVDEGDNILDGHHRYEIDHNAPVVVVPGLSTAEKEAFVFRANFVRRNLSPAQKDEARRKMKATAFRLRDEDAKKWTQKRVAEVLGVSRSTIEMWFAAQPTTNDKPVNGGRPDSNGKPKSAPDARVKINPAKKPEIAAAVKAGKPQAQVAADLGVSQQAVSKIVREEEKKEEAAKERSRRVAATEKAMKADGDYNVKSSDFREVAKSLPDGSVDLIFTDPPYDRKTLPLYGDLAKEASRILCDGGSLICYLGQYQIHEVLDLVSPHLRLWWTLAVQHTGRKARMFEYGVVVHWKPMLWFVKGTRGDKETFVDDLIVSQMEKDNHDWQQSLIEASYYIEKLCPKGGLVFDPFCGGGTTAVAAKVLKRRWITCDTDEASVVLARQRIAEAGK